MSELGSMKLTDIFAAIGSLLGAASMAFSGHIGWMIAFLLIVFLVYRLHRCESKHATVESQNRELAVAVALLASDRGEEAKRRAMRLAGIVSSDDIDDGDDTRAAGA